MAKDPVTLQDVADAAGVSIATASRALTGKSRVSKQTAARVARVAERLGYRVNVFGRALREGTGRTVGMVVPVISNPFFGQLVHHLEAELLDHGLDLVIADSHGETLREGGRLRMLVERRVEGIIVVPSDAEASGTALARAAESAPVVQLDRRVEGLGLDYVGVDNAKGMQLLACHLHECGVRQVVLVASDATTSTGRERRAAFEGEAARVGMSVQEPILDEFTLEFGQSAARELASRPVMPDAVIAGDDLIAMGLLIGLKRAGLSVPDDVLVTGFDGTMLAEISDPPLTTIEQPFASLARETVRALVRRIDEADAPVLFSRIAPRLRVAGSTQRESGPVTGRPGPD